MPIIRTVDVRKVFRSVKREPGLGGALRALFSREYEEKVAVDRVSFAVEPGELVGYLGPNGAGKSTTIKMLTGILVPTSGEIRVCGLTPHANRQLNAQHIGVVFGQRSQLYWDLPLRESFELLRSIYDVPRPRFLENVRHFSDILELGRFMETPVRQLSLGERMRGDFAAAMLHDPQVVFLDEPTIGLDVVAKQAIREFISRANLERGTTVILTTHDLADVERLARRVILIDDGLVIYDGSLAGLRDEYGNERTVVATLALEADVRIAGARAEVGEGNVVRLSFDRRETTAEAVVRQLMNAYEVRDLSIVEPDIDGIVRRIYLEGYIGGVTGAATP